MLTIKPLLTYSAEVTLPGGITTAANNALPGCDVSSINPLSGVGECSVTVAAKYFPAAGRITVSVALQALVG